MMETEVTQQQYASIVEASQSSLPPTAGDKELENQRWYQANPSSRGGPKKINHPVERVSWQDAAAFCQHLSKLDPQHRYRLPTETEWEYACRAGTKSPRYGDIEDIAWVFANTDEGNGSTGHRPAGTKAANAWGLHDMLGNVAEWCFDWYGPAATSSKADDSGPKNGKQKVVRGGDCMADPGELREEGLCMAASRSYRSPNETGRLIGFRIVVENAPDAPTGPVEAGKVDSDKTSSDEIETMKEKILTLCLFPFPKEPLWVIAETEVSSLDDLEEMGADACESNTTIETHPADDKKTALKRAREVAKERGLSLYQLTIGKERGDGDSLEVIAGY